MLATLIVADAIVSEKCTRRWRWRWRIIRITIVLDVVVMKNIRRITNSKKIRISRNICRSKIDVVIVDVSITLRVKDRGGVLLVLTVI